MVDCEGDVHDGCGALLCSHIYKVDHPHTNRTQDAPTLKAGRGQGCFGSAPRGAWNIDQLRQKTCLAWRPCSTFQQTQGCAETLALTGSAFRWGLTLCLPGCSEQVMQNDIYQICLLQLDRKFLTMLVGQWANLEGIFSTTLFWKSLVLKEQLSLKNENIENIYLKWSTP